METDFSYIVDEVPLFSIKFDLGMKFVQWLLAAMLGASISSGFRRGADRSGQG